MRATWIDAREKLAALASDGSLRESGVVILFLNKREKNKSRNKDSKGNLSMIGIRRFSLLVLIVEVRIIA